MRAAAVFLLLVIATPAVANAELPMPPAIVDELPEREVRAARLYCANLFPDDFSTRLYCEDQQFKSIQKLIQRGSIRK